MTDPLLQQIVHAMEVAVIERLPTGAFSIISQTREIWVCFVISKALKW